MSDAVLTSALQLRSRGFSVVPTKPGTKRPPLKWGEFIERRAREDEVRDWYRRWPDAGVAVITGPVSGVVVLDVDGEQGRRNLAALGAVPPTLAVNTGKGMHYYFTHPGIPIKSFSNNAKVKNSPQHLWGIDVKGDGGKANAPPSLHYNDDGAPSGRSYQWAGSPDAAIAPMPGWLLDLCTKDAGEAEPEAPVKAQWETTFPTLEELLANPAMHEPPVCVVPRLAYAGRLVVLAGRDKAGKSTLAAHATAAVTKRGYFLNEAVAAEEGRVLHVGLEEATGDAVRRLRDLGAAPRGVRLVALRPPQPLAAIREALTHWPADLVVIDSLTEYARITAGRAPDDGDNAGWADIMRPLVELAHEQPGAVLVLHHMTKDGTKYRGATEIAAAADMLLELEVPSQADSLRKITGRGRWRVEPFAVRLGAVGYELEGDGTTLSIDARILLYVEQHRGASKRDLRSNISGRNDSIDAAVHTLLQRGALVNRGTGDRWALYPPVAEPQQTLGEGLES